MAEHIITDNYSGDASPLISGDTSWPTSGELVNFVDGDTVTIAAGTTLSTTGSRGASVGGMHLDLTVDGTLEAEGYAVSSSFADITLDIGEAGSLTAHRAFYSSFGDAISITNAGMMESTLLNGISAIGHSTVFIENSGTIKGADNAISLAGNTTSETLKNLAGGLIEGDCWFSSGIAVLVSNAGTIDGDCYLEAGDDKFFNSGIVTGTIDMGRGADTFNGKNGSTGVTVEGGEGNDRLLGSSGDDALTGGDDKDRIKGRDGEDTIAGGNGNDWIAAGGGDDMVGGGAGSDRILGGEGDDRIEGGAGRDHLRGDAGADTFVFATADDSLTVTADHIRDFVSGIDKFDLSAIAEFSFIAEEKFDGTGAQLRFRDRGDNLRVEADVDGDGMVDMYVHLHDVDTLALTDFIL